MCKRYELRQYYLEEPHFYDKETGLDLDLDSVEKTLNILDEQIGYYAKQHKGGA